MLSSSSFTLAITALAGMLATTNSRTAEAADRLVPNQFPSIQSAIDACSPGDRVLVSPGVYTGAFRFNGKPVIVESTSGSTITILDLTSQSGSAVRAIDGEPIGTQLRGFTIRGTTASAIEIGQASHLQLFNCRIADCITGADSGGGGISVSGGTAFLGNCQFENVRASSPYSTAVGGAIGAVNESEVTITNCTFLNCSAEVIRGQPTPRGLSTPTLTARGGAIWASTSSITVSGTRFEGCAAVTSRVHNSCQNYGAVYSSGGAVTLAAGSIGTFEDCDFIDCSASATDTRSWTSSSSALVSSSAKAGAIEIMAGASLVSRRCLFDNARATAGIHTSYGCTSAPPNSWGQATTYATAGAISVAGQGVPFSFDSTDDEFVEGGVFAGTDRKGGHLYIESGSTGVTVRNAKFSAVIGAPTIQCVGGTALALLNSTISGSNPTALHCSGTAPLVSGCFIRGTTGAPITSVSTPTGPTIVNTIFCENTPNSISGPWFDAGGNRFENDCVDVDCNGNGLDDTAEITAGVSPDCNSNGRPDICDINDGTTEDCDGDEIPDICAFPPLQLSSSPLTPVQSGTTLTHSFTNLPPTGTDVVLTLEALADLSSTNENISVRSGTNVLGTAFQIGGADCLTITDEITLTPSQFEALLSSDRVLSLQFVPSFAVSAGVCGTTSLRVSIEYMPIRDGDCNANGNPDACDVKSGASADVNADGTPDECQDLASCPADYNHDGVVNAADLSTLLVGWGGASADLDQDGVAGASDLALLLAMWGNCG